MVKKLKFTNKFIIILGIALIYTLFLMLYDDNDFTGILILEQKLDNIKNKKNVRKQKIQGLLNRFSERLSFVLTTISTIGYGDIMPKRRSLRIINSLFILLLLYITFNL